jgi:hypothetical protein
VHFWSMGVSEQTHAQKQGGAKRPFFLRPDRGQWTHCSWAMALRARSKWWIQGISSVAVIVEFPVTCGCLPKKQRGCMEIWPGDCINKDRLLWERERTTGHPVCAGYGRGSLPDRMVFFPHLPGRLSNLRAFRFALAMGEVVQRAERLFFLRKVSGTVFGLADLYGILRGAIGPVASA